MASNYEYDSLDNGEYGGTPDYSEWHAVYEMPRVPFTVFNIEMFLIFPIILIANLVLFIKIVGNKKIRSEPWRWLIAHASVCIFVRICFMYNELMPEMYGVPSLKDLPSGCPAIVIMHHIVSYMSVVSVVLVVTERFHALRLGKENEGGMTKKAVILTLVIFWVLLIISQILPVFIMAISGHPAFTYYWYVKGPAFCYVNHDLFNSIILMALTLWALLTFIVAIIGMVVLRNRKTTTEPMKKSIITPTLAVSSIALVFLAIHKLIYVSLEEVKLGDDVSVLFNLLGLIHEFAFPIIWLVTWSHNRDISLKCGGGDDGEHKPLLEEQLAD